MSFDPSSESVPELASTPQERQWAIFAHLSCFLAIWAFGLAFLGPLIIWLLKREEMPFVGDQAKEALNFSITMLIAVVVYGIVAVVGTFVTVGFGLILFVPLGIALSVVQIALPIMAAVKANVGTVYRYPFTLRLVK